MFALRKACSALESQQRQVRYHSGLCRSLTQVQVHGQERIPLPPWETELLAACLAGLKHFVLKFVLSKTTCASVTHLISAATMPMTPDLEASVVRRLYTLGEVCLHMSGQVQSMFVV